MCEDVKKIFKEKYCYLILIWLGWYDVGMYDKNVVEWLLCGGVNGSLRYSIEFDYVVNVGLFNVIVLFDFVKEKYFNIFYVDFF